MRGVAIFHYKALRELFNARIYLDLPTEERVKRTIARDKLAKGKVITQYRLEYLKNTAPSIDEKWVRPQEQYATHKIYSSYNKDKVIKMVLSTLKLSVS